MKLFPFPRIRLAHLPTPLEEMSALQQTIGCTPRLFVKRDDCTGLAGGGNKTRKLEFTLADVRAQSADVIITSGGVQSNHVRQTAAAAAKLGLKFHGILANSFSQATYKAADVYATTGNRLLVDILGGQLHFVEDDGPATEKMITTLVEETRADGLTPYVVPVGASNGIGAMGYAVCAAELLQQFRKLDIAPSHMIVATGSAGTHGGLLAGLRALDSQIKVIGVSVSEPAVAKRAKVRRIVEEMATLWGSLAPVIEDDDIVVREEFVGRGYAVPSVACVEAIRLLAESEGLLLDPVYTGKAMAGCLEMVRSGELEAGRDIVFLHTGGSPALFAYPELFA